MGRLVLGTVVHFAISSDQKIEPASEPSGHRDETGVESSLLCNAVQAGSALHCLLFKITNERTTHALPTVLAVVCLALRNMIDVVYGTAITLLEQPHENLDGFSREYYHPGELYKGDGLGSQPGSGRRRHSNPCTATVGSAGATSGSNLGQDIEIGAGFSVLGPSSFNGRCAEYLPTHASVLREQVVPDRPDRQICGRVGLRATGEALRSVTHEVYVSYENVGL
ncbi:hypothetical protein NPX13_g6011 [Xylaria arbuscula]|uniref:Uncharacterized protein n=1 Tax=Xylaria arbuscula TaxID=114810 RepID=A0A9W8ND20_9PEZI|nr:hypothetical protein NPX13_g6011 [Xylaria arbuscula]